MKIVGWIALAVLLVLPLIVGGTAANLATRMLIAALFALAFNLLWQHARLLSFGHAVYFGAGLYAAVHLMRAAEAGLDIPLPLIPLAAALIAGAVGVVLGFMSTIRGGTYFAMITLAIGELIHSLGPRLPTLFGAESGMSTMRMPARIFGVEVSFGPMTEVYALVLAWSIVGAGLLRFFATTPLGRITFALGDNEERLRALGYRTHLTKTALFALSAAISGLAGALLGVTNENADYEIFAGAISAQPVLQVFIGGASTFLGPALGAALLTWIGSQVSDMTRLWLLYQGLLFVLVVLFAPTGIAGLLERAQAEIARLGVAGAARRIGLRAAGAILVAAATVYICEAAFILLSEAYAGQRTVIGGWPPLKLFGMVWPALSPVTWVTPLVTIGLGGLAIWLARRRAGDSVA